MVNEPRGIVHRDGRAGARDAEAAGDAIAEGREEAGKGLVLNGIPLIEEATGLKERANKCVKRKQYEEAVCLYEDGLRVLNNCRGQSMLAKESQQVDSLRAVLHGNIAQCMLNQQLYRRAVEAATQSLELDPGGVKALHRRSQAYEALREYEDALKDALTLKKLGGGGLNEKDMEDRCEKLLLTLNKQNMGVNKVAKENEEMFKMKERFDKVFEKYDLEDTDAAAQVAKWLVSDKDFAYTVEKIAKQWRMEHRDAKDFATWIRKGLELKIIPNPQNCPQPEAAN